MSFCIALLAGLATGILSGFGIGGGTLLLIYMTSLAHLDQNLAQGINLLYFLPTAASALLYHKKNGYLKKEAAWPAILWGLVGTALAAFLATSLDVEVLRKCFGVFLLFVGLHELFRKKAK